MLLPILAVLFIAYVSVGMILFFMQPKFLYSPVKDIPYSPGELDLEFDNVTFKSNDRLNLHGWFVPAKDAALTILFCHGNGGNMMHCLDSINFFHDLGLNCFIFDYRGYGTSEGKPSEEGTYRDALAAYRWLKNKKKIQPENIIIFGRSLGGSIAAQLATKVQIRAVAIESAFTSYPAIGQKFYPYMPVRIFARFSYKTIEYLKKIHCPVMIIHSRNDEVIPFEFGLQLHQAANQPSKFIEIFGSHNDGFLVSGEKYKNGWKQWLDSLKQPTNNTHQNVS